jgi:hypothetical protein
MNHSLGLMIETLVAILLLLTIGYCMLLNKRLQRLKADEHSLKAVIAELITATEIADRAISGLKVTVRECDQNLGERLRAAERFSASMDEQLAAGDTVLRRLSQIAAAGRPAPPAQPPAAGVNPQSTLAAAQALVERARTRTGDRAA